MRQKPLVTNPRPSYTSRTRDKTLFVGTEDGNEEEINTLDFKFIGKIVTKVSHINNGQPSIRSGEMTFRISGKRQYWRLKEMQNPDDGVVDYVDIFFKKYETNDNKAVDDNGDDYGARIRNSPRHP